jgi:acyl carrier protein
MLSKEKYFYQGEIRSFYTGDLGRFNKEGKLEFIGRKDSQVKINGYRIEQSEIEASTIMFPNIISCAVVLSEKNGISFLTLFYVSMSPIEEQSIRNHLKLKLPSYMIPKYFVHLNEMPLLPNFKRDNKRLSMLLENHLKKSNEEVVSKSENELIESIREIWTSFLGNDSFKNNLSWKDAGGDSISLVHMVVQLEIKLGVKIHNEFITGELQRLKLIDYLSHLNTWKIKNSLPKLFYFPPIYGMTTNGKNLLKEFSSHFDVTIIKYPNWDSMEKRKINIEEISKYLFSQIPEYNKPNVGYIGNCQGVNFMQALFKYFPLKECAFIGNIDGLNDIVDFQEKPFMIRFLKNLNYTYLSPNKYFIFLMSIEKHIKNFYFNIEPFRKAKKYWYFFISPFLSKRSIAEMKLFDLGNTFFSNLNFIHFCSENNVYYKSSHHPLKNHKNTYIKLKGTHQDLLNEENRTIIKEFIISLDKNKLVL